MSNTTLKLKFYTNKKWLPTQGTPFILLAQLLWGKVEEEKLYDGLGRFDNFFKIVPKFIEWTNNIHEADFWVLPSDYKHYKKNNCHSLIKSVTDEAKKANKWVIIQYKDDGDDDITFVNLIVLRTSFYRSSKKNHEYAMPVWSEDIFKKYNFNFDVVNKKYPSIGFTGMAMNLKGLKSISFILQFILYIFNFLSTQYFTKIYSTNIRFKFLNRILRDSRIKCHFILRNAYIGGVWLSKGNFNLLKYDNVRNEFINNLKDVDYVADFRGGGNYTLRFYEALCAGRIPVVLDSDRVFPLDELINWNDFILLIPFSKYYSLNDVIVDHYNKFSDNLSNLKKVNRQLWEDYISPEGYYIQQLSLLKNKYVNEK